MNMEEIYQSIEHIAKCEMYDAIEVKYLKSKFEELQQENQKYKEVIDKVLEDIKEYKELNYSKSYENEIEIELIDKILKVLGDD